MKKFVLAILIITSTLCALTNCSQPIGTLEHKLADEVEAIWLVPRRQLYALDDKFQRDGPLSNGGGYPDADFQLFAVDNGMVSEILPPFTQANGVLVELAYHIGLSTEQHFYLYNKEDGYHPFYVVGLHKVFVSYGGKQSWYAIEVHSPNNGNSLGGDDGIGIIWLD